MSHQLFLPPPERPPLPLPSRLPVPTIWEILVQARATSESVLPLAVHLLSIIYLVYSSRGELFIVALTFLALIDFLAGVVRLIERTMLSFDVWQTSTLQFPFGLQRMEALAEFGLGIFGAFNGLYVVKETIEDIIIGFGEDPVLLEGSSSEHHHHHHLVDSIPR